MKVYSTKVVKKEVKVEGPHQRITEKRIKEDVLTDMCKQGGKMKKKPQRNEGKNIESSSDNLGGGSKL